MKNINKQEELVSALWDFAKGLQYSQSIKDGTCAIARSINGGEFETKMDMEILRKTIERIAKNFNLEIQPVQ